MSLLAKNASPAIYHEPVMMDKVISFLLTDRNGIYVDATLGGGGHTAALLARLSQKASVVGIDADPDAISAAQKRLGSDPRIHSVQNRFSKITSVLKTLRISDCNGILADLGISSHQIDTPDRGFSYLSDGPLDMRMNSDTGESAATLLARLDEVELANIIYKYGEERHSRRIARKIKAEDKKNPDWTTKRLASVIESVLPVKLRVKSIARVFQALRIAVNGELVELERFLASAFQILISSGRLVVISYHSLEDRLVKQFMVDKTRTCICPPEAPLCTCNHKPEGRVLTKKAILPDEEEVQRNSRARSAKLRAIEKIE
ncbi:MAG: 16S rRNA (cytosine(1402)-N(4))-methyltransferase RsmH [bacterium]